MIETDGIIFDMDGTIWDTCDEVAKTWQLAAENNGVAIKFTRELIKSCMGLVMEDFAKKAMPDIKDEALRLKIFREGLVYENEYLRLNGGNLYPKVIETLETLAKDIPLFIVSNCQAGYIESFMEAHHTEHLFKDYENPGRTGKAKAENISLICQRNNLKNPVYVGDTQGDLNACLQANVPFVYAAYGFGEVEKSQCEAVVQSFEDLGTLFVPAK